MRSIVRKRSTVLLVVLLVITVVGPGCKSPIKVVYNYLEERDGKCVMTESSQLWVPLTVERGDLILWVFDNKCKAQDVKFDFSEGKGNPLSSMCVDPENGKYALFKVPEKEIKWFPCVVGSKAVVESVSRTRTSYTYKPTPNYEKRAEAEIQVYP
jgi:hypothetical protein